ALDVFRASRKRTDGCRPCCLVRPVRKAERLPRLASVSLVVARSTPTIDYRAELGNSGHPPNTGSARARRRLSPEELKALQAQWERREARVKARRDRLWWLSAAGVVAIGYLASLLVSLIGGAILTIVLLFVAWQLFARRVKAAVIREIPGLADME